MGVSKEDLAEYVKKDSVIQEKKYLKKKKIWKNLLKRLENIQSIVLEDGCYHISETILIEINFGL